MTDAPTYAAPWQAAADAKRLDEGPQPPRALLTLQEHLRMILGNPRADCTVLLIQADALRETAQWATTAAPSYARALLRWADHLGTVAATRINPLEAP